MSPQSERGRRILILAPFGRDGNLIAGALQKFDIESKVCGSIEELCSDIWLGAGAVLVAQEALSKPAVEAMEVPLKAQASWSSLAVFVMMRQGGGDSRRNYSTLAHRLGNVTFLERPVWTEAMASSVKMALRAREHQYQIRDHLEAARASASALEGANLELQRANEDLSQFAFSTSHDLQQPLRMISVYSELLERRLGPSLDEECTQFLRYARLGAKQMEALLKDLLAYIQVTDTNHQEKSQVRVKDCIGKVLATLQSMVEASGARIEIGPMPVLWIEEVYLIQLFQNIVGNALKYRGESPPEIRIEAKQQGPVWLFSVRDNGIGIEEEYAEQIFGIFKRLHSAEQFEGTGIGLAICRKIVERHGGRIWVQSDGVGKGSTFYFTLREEG